MGSFNFNIISLVPFIIEGVKNTLNSHLFNISIYSNDLNEILQVIKNKPPDMLLIDDSCQNRDDFILFVKQIIRMQIETKVIIYSDSNEPSYIKNLIDIGIRGLLHKKTSQEKLFDAIELLHKGGCFYDNLFNYSILNFQNQVNSKNLDILSKREQEVLSLMRIGLPNRKIAAKMLVSVKTVETYKERIKDKLEISNIKILYDLLYSPKDT